MFTSILTGVIALTGIVVLFVLVLMFCESKLVQKGSVKLIINDDPDKSPEVAVGSNLLMALSNEKIFLPSACGGKAAGVQGGAAPTRSRWASEPGLPQGLPARSQGHQVLDDDAPRPGWAGASRP